MEPRARILTKAHELFSRYGIRSVSMDEISAQLGISKKTIYQSYTEKEELVKEVFFSVLEANKTQCLADKKKAENPIHELFLAYDMMKEMLATLNPSVVYDLQKYHPNVYARFHEYKTNFLFGIIKSNLEKGVKDELYRRDIDVDVLTRFRIESVMLAFNSEVFPSNRTQLIHIEEQLLEHFLFGIVTAKGQKLVQKYKQQRAKK